MKVAIVCDWLTSTGGAERVVRELHRMYPDAPIYTSQYDPKVLTWFNRADIRTTWLQKLPMSLRKFLPVLRAWTFSRLDLSDYDLVISSSGAEAKAVKTGTTSLHVWYCLAPTHYYWSRYEDYLRHPGFGYLDWLARLGLKLLVGPMRMWDKRAAQKPDYILADSTYTKHQVKKYYGRESQVLFPPVDTLRFKPKNHLAKREGFLIAGRQTPYKRFDLAVAAATKTNLPLTVIGNGPEHAKLISMAGPSVKFVNNVKDRQMMGYFQSVNAFIFPGVDDFGIVAVEALSAGTPVIAYQAGGALDYVEPGATGLFFKEQTVDALAKTLKEFDSSKFNNAMIVKQSEFYSTVNFHHRLAGFLKTILA